ncbi:flagellar export chaperone FliS [Immundisolibacter sp.]|jgi:flagellar secretion chaperone FliS|uniref:flagellar export chaperone FliS n=1 Tax=Immundisolibacter sp. TaxID=1934948 RepID=UPI000EEEE678|nr:flagellar export chaperone FliS [Gammaproteobacteria bacterium]
MSPSSAALKQYAAVQVQSSVSEASPHRLTAMLFDGAIERINQAKGHMQRGELARQGELISAAMAIVAELAGSLNRDVAPQFVDHLDGLYDYIQRRLLEANRRQDLALLDEAGRLLGTVAEAWHAIGPDRPSAARAGA